MMNPLRAGIRLMPRSLVVLLTLVLISVSALADRALYLDRGDDIARATLDSISAAKQEVISIEFLMRDDEFGLMKMGLLRKKALEGKKVFMQVDALHFMVHAAYIKALLDAGVDVLVYNKLSLEHLTTVAMRDHTKILVIDGIYLKMGDSNTGNEYVQWGDGHHMNSRDVYIEGEAARGARHYAMQLHDSSLVNVPSVEVASKTRVSLQRAWIKAKKMRNKVILRTLGIGLDAPDLLANPDKLLVTQEELDQANATLEQAAREYENVRIAHEWGEPMKWLEQAIPIEKATFVHDPVGKKGVAPGMEMAVNAFMSQAKSSLNVFSPYLVLTPGNRSSLQKAEANGAAVNIMTNSLKSSDNITVQSSYEYRAAEYAQMGKFNIWEANGPETWHAKVLERDGEHLIIMSYNIDYRSMDGNMETGLYIKGAQFVSHVNAKLAQDVAAGFTQVAANGALLPAKASLVRTCEELFSTQPIVPPKLTKKLVIKFIEKKL